MRLTDFERERIQSIVRKHAPQSTVFLFGSRIHDHLRGGDIDLLILGKGLTSGLVRKIKIEIKDALGDQKIDILTDDPDEPSTFGRLARLDAIPL